MRTDRCKHGRTDDGRKVVTIANPEHSSGELKILGPVVQSSISLMSWLVVKMLTVLVSAISSSQVFLLKKYE